MAGSANQFLILELRYHINDMTGRWSNVKERRAYFKNVIYLAGMNNSSKRISHHNHVQIRGRERPCQFIQRLVGETNDVAQLMLSRIGLHFVVFTAATFKTESDTCMIRQRTSRCQQSVQ